MVVDYLLIIVPCLIIVAFLTLIERKILSYIQSRKGPNKTSMQGFLQPIRDAVKLFCKEWVVPDFRNVLLFLLSPVLRLTLVMQL